MIDGGVKLSSFEREPLDDLVFDPVNPERLFEALRTRYKEESDVRSASGKPPLMGGVKIADLLTREEQGQVAQALLETSGWRVFLKLVRRLSDVGERVVRNGEKSRGRSRRSASLQRVTKKAMEMVGPSATAKDVWDVLVSSGLLKIEDLFFDQGTIYNHEETWQCGFANWQKRYLRPLKSPTSVADNPLVVSSPSVLSGHAEHARDRPSLPRQHRSSQVSYTLSEDPRKI